MIRTATFKGKEYKFEDYDNPIWEHAEENFKNEVWNIREGDIVLDVGAGAGEYALTTAVLGGHVYSFEPNPVTFDKLKHNISLNNNGLSDRITAYEMGVMDRPLKFNFSPKWNSFMMHQKDKKEDEIAVEATTIDEFVEKQEFKDVNFIKIDVEGSELLVLEGAKKTLKKFAPHILIEAHTFLYPDENHLRKIDDILTPFGYQCLMFSYLKNDKYKEDARRHYGSWFYGALLYFEAVLADAEAEGVRQP